MGDARYSFAEVRCKNGRDGTPESPVWIVIKDSVYDVTSYISQHPGGPDMIAEEAGSDATAAFDDVGHSGDARKILAKYKIGEIIEDEKVYDENGRKKKRKVVPHPDQNQSRSCMNIVTCGLLG